MTILLSAAILVAVIAVTITFLAVTSARDGYEDELGFHVVQETVIVSTSFCGAALACSACGISTVNEEVMI